MKNQKFLIIGVVALSLAVFIFGANYYRKMENESRASQNSVLPDNSLLIKDTSPSIGPSIAKVTLVEFLDPECESCRMMHPVIKNILKDYENKIRYVLRYMPFHANSAIAASWLEATRDQNKFWESLDILFLKQPEWGDHHSPKPELIPQFLKEIGVDIESANIARSNPEIQARIEQDKKDGLALGVGGTPTYFVNGHMLLELGEFQLKGLINEELAK